MKAYLINMHLLVPRLRSSAKVKVKYKGYISQKMAVSGAFVFHKHILFSIMSLSDAMFKIFPVYFQYVNEQAGHVKIDRDSRGC